MSEIAVKAAAAARPSGIRGLHYKLYDWVLHWSAHRHAQPALFTLAFMESSVFPVPPDALLITMSLARPKRARVFALICTVGSVLGGLFGYLLGWSIWALIRNFFFHYLGPFGFTPLNFAKMQQLYQENAFWAVFTAGFTPIPYKVFTIGAGVFEISLLAFAVASILGRAGRFFLVAEIMSRFGARAMPFIEKYLGWLTLAFVVLLVGFYWVFVHLL